MISTGPSGMITEDIDLPPYYSLEDEADAILLLGPDGDKVAVFSARGCVPSEIEKTAWHDFSGQPRG